MDHARTQPPQEPGPAHVAASCAVDAEALLDTHGAALLALASTLLPHRAGAERVVTDVLVEAAASDRGIAGDQEVRRTLARRVYSRCAVADPHPGPNGAEWPSTWSMVLPRARLSYPQRAAVALSVFGAHSYRQVADLMCLPAGTVAELQRSALHRLHRER